MPGGSADGQSWGPGLPRLARGLPWAEKLTLGLGPQGRRPSRLPERLRKAQRQQTSRLRRDPGLRGGKGALSKLSPLSRASKLLLLLKPSDILLRRALSPLGLRRDCADDPREPSPVPDRPMCNQAAACLGRHTNDFGSGFCEGPCGVLLLAQVRFEAGGSGASLHPKKRSMAGFGLRELHGDIPPRCSKP